MTTDVPMVSIPGSRGRGDTPAPRPAGARVSVILVVDDREDNRLAAQVTLEAEGYRVALAACGEDAIAAVAAEPPDCILLDVRMPGLDGFGVCQRIRGLPRGGDVPVIFLTGLRDVETFDRALSVGGTDFLTKPIQSAELLTRVASALKVRRLSAELREQYDLFKLQRDVLVRVQLQRERLMAFVVHDLKNPVSAMDLHAQVLLRDKALPAAVRDSAAQIRIEAGQLTRMILDLLDLSKQEEGKLSLRRSTVDLGALSGRVVSEMT